MPRLYCLDYVVPAGCWVALVGSLCGFPRGGGADEPAAPPLVTVTPAAGETALPPSSDSAGPAMWARLLQIVTNAQVPLEGLIKPEQMGAEISGNQAQILSGNTASASFQFLPNLNITIHFMVTPHAKKPATSAEFTRLDRDGDSLLDRQEFRRASQVRETRRGSKRGRRRAAQAKPGDTFENRNLSGL
ncbi:MAG: hypothetical protein AB7F89_01505 [Pirellulaceae bacterium]